MRILIISEVFYPEDFIVNDLARELKSRGHYVCVMTQYPSYPQSYVFDGYRNEGYSIEDWDGIKIYRFPFVEGYKQSKIKKFHNYLDFIFDGRKYAKEIGDGFDHVFVSQTGPLTVCYPALAIKKKFGTPVTVWTCDIWPDVVYSYGVPKNFMTKAILDRVIRGIYQSCDNILVSSRMFAAQINEYCSTKIQYAPNWLRPTEETESEVRLNKNVFNFTFTGNISLYQNLLNAVAGFAKANIPDAVFNIIGNGSYYEELKAYVESNNIRNVILYGRRPYTEMHDILSQSSTLVLPLIPNEGIMKTEPFKLQSYLQAGKPVFGIIGGSGKEIIEENNLGVCSDPNNIDDIAEGFRKSVAFAKEHSDEVREKARYLMETRFNKEKIVNLIESVITGKKASTAI